MRKLLMVILILCFLPVYLNRITLANVNELYLCMVEYRMNVINEYQKTNQLAFDMYTSNGNKTVEEAAKEQAREYITKLPDPSTPFFKSQNSRFVALGVKATKGGGLKLREYMNDNPTKYCPFYVSKHGNPCNK
jgi:hypothetical protein